MLRVVESDCVLRNDILYNAIHEDGQTSGRMGILSHGNNPRQTTVLNYKLPCNSALVTICYETRRYEKMRLMSLCSAVWTMDVGPPSCLCMYFPRLCSAIAEFLIRFLNTVFQMCFEQLRDTVQRSKQHEHSSNRNTSYRSERYT